MRISNPMNRILLCFWLLSGLGLQRAYAQSTPSQKLENMLGDQSFFANHPTGFVLYDLEQQQVVYEKNSHQYFAPASTTKLLTFYAALVTLGDSTKRLRYIPRGKDLLIWGTGDPGWGYQALPQMNMKEFFAPYQKIYFSDANWQDSAYGYGWQWDDYNYAYAAERSSFPIYGNLVKVSSPNGRPQISPRYFENSLTPTQKAIKDIERNFHQNLYYYNPTVYRASTKPEYIPFVTSTETFALLASEELGKEVIPSKEKLPETHFVLPGIPMDSLYKEMLQESDNFIAEHLLMMVSDELLLKLESAEVIAHLKESLYADMPDELLWFDGSGLSRYNLFTPRSMVNLAEKIYHIVPDTTLFRLLPTGGRSGTLKNVYKAASPYIFAKTGTFSNNHSLVGYIKTRNGKLYAFAFMNNNFPYKARTVITEMEKVLSYIRDNY
ncbi:peptidase S13 [Echinicola pacifica]|uniref:Peptidase S13 n=2 Tax=Echinicola pacifica TaxID=346377 RepID=A0A918UQP2_9BACT|nr:peptidase S13 [Echinicola pacifica]